MISIAHSPDTDDHFFFWALKHGKVSNEGLEFSFSTADTHALNLAAKKNKYDIVAISTATYCDVSSHYLILPHGASIGRNYGPKLVAREDISLASLSGRKVGIPGKTTTAANIFRLIVPEAELVEIPIEPYSKVFEALSRGQIHAAVLIHEGQAAYREYSLKLLLDLGKWWQEETGLPLPLGINVIRRDLGEEKVTQVSRIIKSSITWGLTHQEELLQSLAELNQRRGSSCIQEESIKNYLAEYANADSQEFQQDATLAIRELLLRITGKTSTKIEFAP